MTVSLKTESQTRGQFSLHAKCRYCGNAWFPFNENTFNTPIDALVKCPKCKSKQHLHWIGKAATVSTTQTSSPTFQGFRSSIFEKKIPPPRAETQAAPTPAPQSAQTAPEISPLPEIKEGSDTKRELKPLFKSRLSPAGGKPVFRASSKLQNKTFAKESPPQAKPESKPPEIKPLAPAPTIEIKIEDERAGSKPNPASEPIIIEQIQRPLINEPEVESKAASIEQVQPPRVREPEVERKVEVERKIEEKVTISEIRPASSEPLPPPAPISEPAREIKKVEAQREYQQPKLEPKSMFKSDDTQGVEKSQPKSTFKPSSMFKSTTEQSPRPMFKSQLKRGKHEGKPPVVVPETQVDQDAAPAEPEPTTEDRLEKPLKRHKRDSLFAQKKQEVEVREAPLDDEPEVEKVPVREEKKAIFEPEPPRQNISPDWPTKRKARKKSSEEPSDLGNSDTL